ncbi:SusC/RagA family TonB-linked outer membrane protein [Saccharicrinis sp. FJH62]|uniref:SusC/RagA family TonB-linked outer membrane protein n=1 Tax=Saccharicrinis sp. FJH62 TaxID=3344657 RepID=UPI0035D4EDCF
MMTKYKSLLLIVGFLISFTGLAQVKQITVTGTVTDQDNEPLFGVNVVVKNQVGIGTVTNDKGEYKIKAGENDILVFSFISFEKQEVRINGNNSINVIMHEASQQIEEVAVVAHGTKKKTSVIGAITSIEPTALQSASIQPSNALAGNIAGVIAVQRSGEPGENNSEFWIRGISTFGANSQALILVDGVERNFNEINVEDIQDFTVLKDASATAVYGSRGANGVVLITTKRGKEGKININAKIERGVSVRSKMPDYVDGITYANLANEAAVTRGRDAIYSPSEIEIIGYGLDPDLYPSINWREDLLLPSSSRYRSTLSISGGSSLVQYYISGSYVNESGMYKYGDLNEYDTNVNYQRYNFRSNVNVNVTKTTSVELGIGAWIVDQNKPADGNSDNIWGSFSNLTPITVPFQYSNGLFPAYGSGGNLVSPYVLLSQSGYTTKWESKLETNIAIKQDLSFIADGLNFTGRFSYDAYNYNQVSRLTSPDLYRAEKQRDGYGDLVLRKVVDGYPLAQSSGGWGDIRYYTEASLNYDHVFNQKHRVGGLLLYYHQEYSRNDAGSDIIAAVPKRNQAVSGRVTYAYNDKYMFEYNFGYTGSENFEKGSRYGFFPAVALGWRISQENFMDNLPWVDEFKLRFSYGEVGNDQLNQRFPYITTVGSGTGYRFGENAQIYLDGLRTLDIGAQNLSWETAKKYDFGIDTRFFNRLDLVADVFKDRREDIFMLRGYVPYAVGLLEGQQPWANVGVMESQGIDGTASFEGKIGKLNYTIRGNFTYSTSDVIDYDEAANSLYYQQTEGYRWQQTRGLIALGLFQNEEEIANSPVQTFGTVMPGDIKYKDVNGDGQIDDADVVPIGHATIPEIQYGTGLSLRYKNIDFSTLFQGTGSSDFFIDGNIAYPFSGSETGNISSYVANESNRWISSDFSGSTATENPDAMFPRLTYGPNQNNNRNSTFWLRNNRYLRLKNMEIGYNLNRNFIKKFHMQSARIYLIATNLLVFSPFDWWDPEQDTGNGAAYPLQKSFTLSINVNF